MSEGDTRRKLMRLLEPGRMGRAPAISSPPREPAPEAAAPTPQAPPPAPVTPALARRIAALRDGGSAWQATEAEVARPAPAPETTIEQAPPAPPAPTGLAARLEAMKRDAALTVEPPAAPEPATSKLRRRLDALRRDSGRTPEPETPRALQRAPSAGMADFERLFPAESRPTPHGPAWVLQDNLPEDTHHGDRALGSALAFGGEAVGAALSVLTGEPALRGFDLRGALFLDLESTGLALTGATLPFLVGAAHFHGNTLVLEQWLLRTPDDEEAALHDLAARIEAADWLVSFNGRTFDLPLLRTRWRMHRQRDPSEGLAGHLDLLPVSRRTLKHGLPNCRLGTLESRVLGLHRVDDVAGSEVPGCYHAWLHDANPAPLAGVVKHNRLDVLSMVTLLDELLGRVLRPESTLLRDPECALKLAERARKHCAPELAERIFTAAALLPSTREAAEKGLARMARAARRGRKP
jgi:uncharacterized protein YprB with RNaseH-like and TPR domain